MKRLLLAATLLIPTPVVAQTAAQLRPHAAEWERLLAAEDARAASTAQLQTLHGGLQSTSAAIRQVAVRALGRLESPHELQHIVPLLNDADAAVRVAAAHAAGQAVYRIESADARAALVAAVESGRDGASIGAAAESLGRLRTASAADARTVATLLTTRLQGDPVQRLGVLRGLYLLARQPSARGIFEPGTAAAVRAQLAAAAGIDTMSVRMRTLALMTLPLMAGADEATLMQGLQDPAPYVRREAVAAAATLPDTAALHRVLRRAMTDAAPARYEAVRIYARRLAATHGCAPVLEAARGADTHVALLAIDLLATSCARDPGSLALADSIARTGSIVGAWHRGAHALVTLATLDSARAALHFSRYAASSDIFVRTYAARAAAASRDIASLRRLATDPHPNVRTVAVQGLSARAAHAADDVYVQALDSDDSELVIAASTALEGTVHAAALPALQRALARITALRRETSRDARLALLERIGELSKAGNVEALRTYLRDFDPAVAASASEIIGRVTGSRAAADPRSLQPLALPRFAELAALEQARVLVMMEGGDTVVLRLLPFHAPTNAHRFARLAREGYFNGLTLHRVVYNFVVQGGSPGANEYAGDGPFTRDELSAPNWRGTLGISTRGRDTGDAQLYFNQVDNVRLDHEYTVFAVVTRGMEAVDRAQEGARITGIIVR